jgi:hypothetical protein
MNDPYSLLANRAHPGRYHGHLLGSINWLLTLPWIALITLLAAAVPIFLCMAPWVDTMFYDLCAENLLRTGLLYRDVFGHGPPGMALCFAGARSLLGWRSEALRAVDLIVVTLVVSLLVRGIVPASLSITIRAWTAFELYFYYLGTSEWNHCQPDVWMLLPALAALALRQRQIIAIGAGKATGPWVFARAGIEGLCWGIAFLLKPFIVFPALACWLVGAAWLRGSRKRALLLADGAGLLTSGAFIGTVVTIWLKATGDWPALIEYLGWNEEYYFSSSQWGERTLRMISYLPPWSLTHLAAIPLAVITILRAHSRRPLAARKAEAHQALLGALYLGWLFQANYLQRQFDYQMAPTIFLAITILASQAWLWQNAFSRYVVVPVCIVLPMATHPLFNMNRLLLWGRCWQEGSTAELRDLLSLEYWQQANPSWRELKRVEEFLRDQGVSDQEVTCYSLSTIPLYREMNLRPSTRYILLWATIAFFPSHHWKIQQELSSCPQRFVVCDARQQTGMPGERGRFPWCARLIFSAGRYQVRQLQYSEALRVQVSRGRIWLAAKTDLFRFGRHA